MKIPSPYGCWRLGNNWQESSAELGKRLLEAWCGIAVLTPNVVEIIPNSRLASVPHSRNCIKYIDVY
jgi:hypothetical protein